MSDVIYRVWGFGAKRIMAMFVFMAAIGAAALAAGALASGPPLWFVGLYFIALGWNTYWFLFRIAFRLDLSGDQLLWRAPLRSVAVTLQQVRLMRPCRLGPTFEVIELHDDRRLLVMARKGFADFAAQVQAGAPHLDIRVGRLVQLQNTIPGPTSLHRD